MLDGYPLVDVHLHPARRATVKPAWDEWAPDCFEISLPIMYPG